MTLNKQINSGKQVKLSSRARRDLVAALIAATVFGGAVVSDTFAGSASSWGPKWTQSGELQLPTEYHTWVFLGSPLTPHALNDGKAGFPEYHNVCIHPEAFKAYRKTGQFPEGTVLSKNCS